MGGHSCVHTPVHKPLTHHPHTSRLMFCICLMMFAAMSWSYAEDAELFCADVEWVAVHEHGLVRDLFGMYSGSIRDLFWIHWRSIGDPHWRSTLEIHTKEPYVWIFMKTKAIHHRHPNATRSTLRAPSPLYPSKPVNHRLVYWWSAHTHFDNNRFCWLSFNCIVAFLRV